MLPPAVDLPPPRPAHSTARPDSSPRSVISHGSHVTTRDDVPDVSPRWMPTRSPTFAVAAGTAAARVVTGIRRRYAVVPSRSPGMNSRATAYWSAGRAMVTCGANSLRTGAGPLQHLLLGRCRHRQAEPPSRPGAQPRQAHRDLVLDRQSLVGLPVQRARGGFCVLVLVVVLLRPDRWMFRRIAVPTWRSPRPHRSPTTRPGSAAGRSAASRDAGRDLQVGHPADREDADVPLDPRSSYCPDDPIVRP